MPEKIPAPSYELILNLPDITVTGLRQSPIDIQSSSTESGSNRTKRSLTGDDGSNAPLTIDYSAITGSAGLTLENTGHGWKLNIPDEIAAQCPITGGPLGSDQYRLLQIHCHWGRDASCGSEHTIDGKSFPCEVHLVHWNSTKYANPSEAMECYADGLSVIGVFINTENSDTDCEFMDLIIKMLPNIQFKGQSTSVDDSIELDINSLIPLREAPKFWNYEGSLTTPPFSESVIWIVMEQPIEAKDEQLSKFRQMNTNGPSSDEVTMLQENFREVQSLNNREIVYFN
ncbi:Phospholipase A2 crotoxin acid subunit CA [Blomia tropicalis]|nr:Phospholipase A2 crotoxin acid subunit CA [Blomia tropicalis]